MNTELKKKKSPVYLRTKLLKDGRQSLYFDIRNDGVRRYKFLRLYLEPETSAEACCRNQKLLRRVEKMRDDLAIELIYSRAGLDDRSFRSGIRLTDWMLSYEHYLERNGSSRSFRYNIAATRKYLQAYNGTVALRDMDGSFIDGFVEFLRKQTVERDGKKHSLLPSTVCCRVRSLQSALNHAVREKLLHSNPCLDTEARLREEEHRREYLTIEEVKRLIATPCSSDVLKRAFLFSVFSALRISDVQNLTWRNIVRDGDQWRVEILQHKTRQLLYLPLNNMARHWLPEGKQPGDKLFPGLRRSHKPALTQWLRAAGITKHVTYHTSRHTFAVLALHAGVDLYTVSRLMGHTSIKHTQAYANIMNGRKRSAVSLLDGVLESVPKMPD